MAICQIEMAPVETMSRSSDFIASLPGRQQRTNNAQCSDHQQPVGADCIPWERLKLSIMDIQRDNLKTLVDIWPSIKDHQEQDTKWGDEIEYILLRFDHDDHTVNLAPEGTRVIDRLSEDKSTDTIDIQPEAYEYMVETSPLKPYQSDLHALIEVERNMHERRQKIQAQLDSSVAVFSLSRFGMFGSPDDSTSDGAKTPEEMKEEAHSLITGGSRYKPTLDAIADRRGHPMNGGASLYEQQSSGDSSTSQQSLDTQSVSVDDPIYAIGGCAVQANFGMQDLSHALHVHDQFCPVGPVMLAITAASPILKGFLIETDARWDHCMMAADDRSPEESHLHSRWGTSPMYFEDLPKVQALNQPLPRSQENDAEFAQTLQQGGVPTPLANYYAYALNRDPMMNPKPADGKKTEADLNDRLVRFKTHMSALWPHIRLKLAAPDSGMPWIVEFRSMETQPTDFEIAAMVVFLQLLQQTILHYKLELRIPIELVDENMKRAQVANAVEHQKFWFNTGNKLPNSSDVRELTLDEIFNGQNSNNSAGQPDGTVFPGLLHHVRNFVSLQASNVDLTSQDRDQIESYLSLVSRRASGAEPTPAKWMRDFVLHHPDYKGDSRVTQKMYYEMMCRLAEKSKVKS